MQNRMKTHQLIENEIISLLDNEPVGRLATVDVSGFPYVIPVHYAYLNQKIYIHGLVKGEKLDNIIKNQKVGFEIDRFEGFIRPEEKNPCNVNTVYQSVIIRGTAKILEDETLKTEALNKIVEKYTPDLAGNSFKNAIKATAVIEITIKECTGKYYK
ncbi:pyridoxamine 5'-phosphate oxidase family protein [Methanolapillus millepedarum]|uniref:Pyridoxamine 5'-phosphate oxidase family protein n=1 Tax=Methanolapillus millepedarum TaxID=3028296 RepID=A0AA96V1I0_9EURY|nr:hypothetical protein MsAc7_02380 [Methanosarcinaceae archaeon Ac7]